MYVHNWITAVYMKHCKLTIFWFKKDWFPGEHIHLCVIGEAYDKWIEKTKNWSYGLWKFHFNANVKFQW